jgi:hypothetical protein
MFWPRRHDSQDPGFLFLSSQKREEKRRRWECQYLKTNITWMVISIRWFTNIPPHTSAHLWTKWENPGQSSKFCIKLKLCEYLSFIWDSWAGGVCNILHFMKRLLQVVWFLVSLFNKMERLTILLSWYSIKKIYLLVHEIWKSEYQ